MRDDVSLSFSAAFVLLLCIVRITRERFQCSFGLHVIIATLSGEGPKVETCNAKFFYKKKMSTCQLDWVEFVICAGSPVM